MSGAKVQPAAKLLADDHGIKADLLVGTGPDGAVCVADVSHAILAKNSILMAQAAAGVVPIPSLGSAARASTVTPSAGASSAQGVDSDLSDEEANAVLWRLGARAGLTKPKATIAPLIANKDGSMWSAKKRR